MCPLPLNRFIITIINNLRDGPRAAQTLTQCELWEEKKKGRKFKTTARAAPFLLHFLLPVLKCQICNLIPPERDSALCVCVCASEREVIYSGQIKLFSYIVLLQGSFILKQVISSIEWERRFENNLAF